MNKPMVPLAGDGPVIFSGRLEKALSSLGCAAFVHLNPQSGTLVLTSEEGVVGPVLPPIPARDLMQAAGPVVSCEELVCDQKDIAGMAEKLGMAIRKLGTGRHAWHSFKVVFANGIEDRIALLMHDERPSETVCGLLSALWPKLREECLIDLQQPDGEVCDKAMLWMIDNEINVSILVMNAQGIILRANAAAKRLLSQEIVLRRTPRGISCINDRQTRQFRDALSACARSDPSEPEQIVFLDADASGLRIPVTLSRFWYEGKPTDLVLVMMPSPPDSRQIERLARAGGLTPAEARVAALLQTGLSNKDAARVAGLKEQSVSTYAKRALNKLNVTSRAEMAQMLTWQATGGKLQ